jgi:hypothetical protein
VVRVPGYRSEMYCASCEVRTEFIYFIWQNVDRLCGLVVRVPIEGLEWGPLSLVEYNWGATWKKQIEVPKYKIENTAVRILRSDHSTLLYQQNMALISPTNEGRSVYFAPALKPRSYYYIHDRKTCILINVLTNTMIPSLKISHGLNDKGDRYLISLP